MSMLSTVKEIKEAFPVAPRGYKGYKDGLQLETLADGNWLVKHNQPVSKIETNSDINLRSLCES
jgi:hypothetical protein